MDEREFILQWHVTRLCDMRCSHCYSPHSDKTTTASALDTEKSRSVVDELHRLGELWHVRVRINFTGGNPLLSPDFWDLATRSVERGIRVGILGNPSSLTNLDVVRRLRRLPVFRYQVSIDGSRVHHDQTRGQGAYDLALQGVDTLVREGIPAVVLATVTRSNMVQIPALARDMFSRGVRVFDFARLVPCGEAAHSAAMIPGPDEYREFLLDMFHTYTDIKSKLPRVRIGRKDPLWMLLMQELGLLRPLPGPDLIYSGCSIGISSFCLDHDGTAYSCRRLGIPVGNVRDTSLHDLFLLSSEMRRERDLESIEPCGTCNLFQVCRGCRAVAYHTSGSYFGRDPSCWR